MSLHATNLMPSSTCKIIDLICYFDSLSTYAMYITKHGCMHWSTTTWKNLVSTREIVMPHHRHFTSSYIEHGL